MEECDNTKKKLMEKESEAREKIPFYSKLWW
jgi:hypothetical protein